MKFSLLKEIITKEADQLKDNAGHQGAWHDGGAESLLRKLEGYKTNLVVKYDLRPSEWHTLDSKEVGEPEEFSKEIEKYKMKLAKDMMKDMKL